MKITSLKLSFAFALALFASTVCQGATLTVTPSIISNTYSSNITFQITGLTNGEMVVLDRFADFNTNGVVDTGELIQQSFRLADGQANVFSGVTNMNAVADLSPTNGAITAKLGFAHADIPHAVGNYVYRLSSPAGGFSPVYATFTITNSDFGQQFTGTVKSGGTNVPNAFVGLLMQVGNDQEFGFGTIADSSGNYLIKAPPGNYLLVSFKDGYVGDFGAAPALTLAAGNTINTNLSLVPATQNISGRLFDLNNTNKGFPGVQFFVQSGNGLFTLGYSKTNGTFDFPVTTGQWELQMEESDLALRGYLAVSHHAIPMVDTTSGSVSNIAVSVPKATALFYGNLKDNLTNPIPGIEISANSGGVYESRALTGNGGGYFLGVTSTNWQVSVSNDDLAARGYSSPGGTNSNINAGQAVQINFVAQPLTAHLIGRVIDGSSNSVSGIRLIASNGSSGFSQGETDVNGDFDVGVYAGTWYLQLESSQASQLGLVGPFLPYTVGDGTNITNIIFVVRTVTAQINGFVRETNSNPVSFVNVFATTTLNGTNYNVNAQTDGSGNYSLGVFNGTWSVGVSGSDLYQRGFDTPTNQTVIISGGSGTANFTVSPIQPLQIITVSLTNGTVGRFYFSRVDASGGRQPYNWTNSGTLPPGLIFDGGGNITGTPTTNGTFNFTATVSDFAGNTTNKNLSITINPALQITTTSLPNGTLDQFYSTNLTASGGQPPYTWSVSGSLPQGLSLSPSGNISGMPTNAGNFYFAAIVNDSLGNNTNKNLSITINPTSAPPFYFISFGRLTNGDFEMLLQGQIGRSYHFEGANTLTNWTILQTSSSNPTNGVVYFRDFNASSFNRRFYRARLLP